MLRIKFITRAYLSMLIMGSCAGAPEGYVSIGNLIINAHALSLNGGAITTTGDQIYTGLIDLGTDTIMTGQNITFNGNVTGNGKDLTLIGVPDDNRFTFNGSIGIQDITVTGS